MSSHRCYTKSNQMSSGFVFTNHLSQVSGSRGKPLFSSVSVKRMCYIDPIGVTHLTSTSQEKKDAYIPTNEYSWRKYCQKPIKGSPHPRLTIYIHQEVHQ
ncbi:hypothetical protein Bca4012_051701 [Brassica carinata]|uniref:WRKY domain-containing protein n=1 Tax=Brassica carinata TaxID=52824 RepID=A0A8X7UMI4_BRACI|nr:hypothetical protein Bca52824_054241 [Brassica carinata]